MIVYLIVPYYMDNRGNSRANTCIGPDLATGRAVLIRYKTNARQLAAADVVIHNDCTDRRALCRRRIIQISALSTLDGRIEAYHGAYG